MNSPLNLFFASVSRLFEFYTTTAVKCKRQYIYIHSHLGNANRIHLGRRKWNVTNIQMLVASVNSNIVKNTYVFHVFFRHFLLLKHFLLPFRKILRYKKLVEVATCFICAHLKLPNENTFREIKKRLKFSGASKKKYTRFYENITS